MNKKQDNYGTSKYYLESGRHVIPCKNGAELYLGRFTSKKKMVRLTKKLRKKIVENTVGSDNIAYTLIDQLRFNDIKPTNELIIDLIREVKLLSIRRNRRR